MNSSSLLKFSFLIIVFIIFLISNGKCQDEDEDDEDIYDEELGDESSTTTRRPRRRTSTTTVKSETAIGSSSALTNGSSTVRSIGVEASTRRVSVPTPASAARTTLRTTTPYDYEDDEPTTTEEEEGYGYIFRPLNNLVENIVAGNVTGIVDNALSIRTPPEIRAFVNNVMSNVFGANIGSALKQFMPHLFSTTPASAVSSNTRDPIPTRAPRPGIIPARTVVVREPVKAQAVLTARTNATEDTKPIKAKPQQVVVQKTKIQQPVKIAFAPPGAPASRLRCEVIS